MKPAILAIAVLLCLTASAAAEIPPTPKKARAVTFDLLYIATSNVATKEINDRERWPLGSGWHYYNCVVQSKRRGRCDYEISNHDDAAPKTCQRRVKVTIAKRTHRVRVRHATLGCDASS